MFNQSDQVKVKVVNDNSKLLYMMIPHVQLCLVIDCQQLWLMVGLWKMKS